MKLGGFTAGADGLGMAGDQRGELGAELLPHLSEVGTGGDEGTVIGGQLAGAVGSVFE